MKILITGFDPFGGETINPAYEAVKKLPDVIDGAEIVKVEVPTVFGLDGQVLKEKESSRIQAWKTTKFKTTDIEKYYHDLIDLYNNNFEQYIIDKLVPKDVNSNSKEIQLLKTAIN